jgi:hypothetical protein
MPYALAAVSSAWMVFSRLSCYICWTQLAVAWSRANAGGCTAVDPAGAAGWSPPGPRSADAGTAVPASAARTLLSGAGRESVNYPSLRRQLGHTALDDAFVAPQWRQTQLLIALIMVPATVFPPSLRSPYVTI